MPLWANKAVEDFPVNLLEFVHSWLRLKPSCVVLSYLPWRTSGEVLLLPPSPPSSAGVRLWSCTWEKPELRTTAMSWIHTPLYLLHLSAGEREGCLLVILYPRSAGLTSPPLCIRTALSSPSQTEAVFWHCSVMNKREKHQGLERWESPWHHCKLVCASRIEAGKESSPCRAVYAAAAGLLLVSCLQSYTFTLEVSGAIRDLNFMLLGKNIRP